MRVAATSNSFWNVVSSMRPTTLKNFASHSQGLHPLEEMGFWSKRTIVEDGHQYWRSYFFFDGDYEVVPLRMGIGQDAVLSGTYLKTLKAQFIQMRRWAYGASDDAYIATRLLSGKFRGSKFDGWIRFFQSLEGHVSLACMSPIVGFGAFAPLYINPLAAHTSILVNDLPLIVSPFYIILTKTFVESVPHEIQEAAEIDGAGIMQIFFRIMLPVIKPIMATIAIFSAVNQWNAFQDTLLLVTDNKLYTLQFILYQYLNQASSLSALANSSTSGSAMAAAVATTQTPTSVRMTVTIIVVIPILVVYPIFQRYFVKGIMIGAVKG